MDSYANGSAQLKFGPIHLKQIKLIAPSQTIALEYEKIAEPIEELIKKLKDQNIFLKQSRDILLPRLMSGTINVES
jgi:type I restriction enzyme S subunit